MTGQFTLAAARRWKRIPQEAQGKILANVWCGNCRDSVQIALGDKGTVYLIHGLYMDNVNLSDNFRS